MRRLLLGSLLVLALAGVALGKGEKGKRVLEAPEVEKNLARLAEKVTWHRSLDEAKAVAAREGKPILWLHVLGDFSGAT
jgi:hypothetical protein